MRKNILGRRNNVCKNREAGADYWDGGDDYKYLELDRANGTYGEMAGVGMVEDRKGPYQEHIKYAMLSSSNFIL